jgi:phosphonate transport system substrate-binding protein
MKKIFSLIAALFLTVTVAACAPAEEVVVKDPEVLIVQFVPSVSIDSATLTRLKGLEDMLTKELTNQGFESKIRISVGTSNASVVEAMDSGQVHVGFLTGQQYAFTTLTYPGKVEVLLTSVRNAYSIQVDGSGNEISDKTALITATRAAGYNASNHPTVKVTSYPAMLLVRTEDFTSGRIATIKDLAGKTVATQNNTSGSGYLYPLFSMNEAGLKFVETGTPNAANGEVLRKVVGGHQNSVIALMNNEVDAVWTFLDARVRPNATIDAWSTANPTRNIFEDTRVIDLSTAILNDTISAVTTLSPGLKAAIQNAFVNVIATTEGADALRIYNHTGYKKSTDADYEGERQFYKFLQTLNN